YGCKDARRCNRAAQLDRGTSPRFRWCGTHRLDAQTRRRILVQIWQSVRRDRSRHCLLRYSDGASRAVKMETYVSLEFGQRNFAAACDPVVSTRARSTCTKKGPPASRSNADRSVHNQQSKRDCSMNVPVKPAHSPFGGSVAARVLRCPASVGLVEKVPAYLRRVSVYAERGTALHTAMALLIDNARSLEGLAGETIEGYTITADDVENALRPAYAYIDTLLDAPGAEFYLEQRVAFPAIPGAFGTVDLIVRIGAVLRVLDLKFGVGVRVLALYPDGEEDVLNAQLMFYAAAARHSLPEFFAGVDKIVLTILQPT